VHLKNLTAPVLNIFASKDHLVPPSASIPLGAYIGSKDYESLEVDAGHIGLYVGGKTRKSVPAAVVAWLQARRKS
jgi:polyhydroxyalkanoate synthase